MDNKAIENNFKTVKLLAESRIAVQPVSFDSHEVEIKLDAAVLTAYKSELYANWVCAAQSRGINLSFSETDLGNYIDMLITLRVDYVNKKRVEISPVDRIAVPSFLSLVLSNVGRVSNVDYGLELVPIVVDAPKVDVDFMWNMSRAIRALSNLGVEFADGYARSKDGSYEFMTMTLIDGSIRNPEKAPHPVYALMASTLGLRGIEAVLSPRINYGSESHMRMLIRHLATTKG
jgi:hypothetical protein